MTGGQATVFRRGSPPALARTRTSLGAARRPRPPGPPLRIRRGTAADAEAIVALIRGLAAYERLAHECRATVARIRRHGFGRRRYFETLVCRRGGRPVGFALYFFTYSTFLARPSLYLEDLFVLPGERGRGAGTALLATLARTAVRRGCGRMEWAVLDWNAPSIRFYQGLGARLRKEWVLTRLTGPALRRLATRRARLPRRGAGRPVAARERGTTAGRTSASRPSSRASRGGR